MYWLGNKVCTNGEFTFTWRHLSGNENCSDFALSAQLLSKGKAAQTF